MRNSGSTSDIHLTSKSLNQLCKPASRVEQAKFISKAYRQSSLHTSLQSIGSQPTITFLC